MQHSLKLGGTNYHIKWVQVPSTAPYWKAWWYSWFGKNYKSSFGFNHEWNLFVVLSFSHHLFRIFQNSGTRSKKYSKFYAEGRNLLPSI